MLCDSCIHNKVCKEIDNFKEYNKQYEQMKKKCSLFDKPIECPCYESKGDVYRRFDLSLNRVGVEIKKASLKNDLKELKNVLCEIIKTYEDLLKDLNFFILDGKTEIISKEFERISSEIESL